MQGTWILSVEIEKVTTSQTRIASTGAKKKDLVFKSPKRIIMMNKFKWRVKRRFSQSKSNQPLVKMATKRTRCII